MTAGGAARKSWLRRALTENLGLKVLALAASIGLFVIVSGTEYEERAIWTDVVTQLPPASAQRMLVSEVPDRVQVTLRGSRSVLNSVRRDGLPPIQLDLSETPTGYYLARNFDPPAGTSLVQVTPSTLTLEWAHRGERRVPIKATIEGEVAEGHTVTATVEPSTVRIQGIASEVNQLEQVWTAAVDVTGLSAGTHEHRVALSQLPRNVTYADTPWVVVTVQVTEESATRRLPDLEVAVVGASGAVVRPRSVDVTVEGSQPRVEALDPARIVPFVDASAIAPGHGAQPASVSVRGVPEGMTATPDPAEVLVTVPGAPE